MLLLKNSILSFTNIGQNMANKIPLTSKKFDQYFSPVGSQINHRDFDLKKLKLVINHLKALKLLVLMM